MKQKRPPEWAAWERWCCRCGLNARPLPSSHLRFRARHCGRSCAGPSLHHRSRGTLRCHPSGLYTFPCPGLGSGLPSAGPDGFPDFGRYAPDRFRSGGQAYQGSALPLSYGSVSPRKLTNTHSEASPRIQLAIAPRSSPSPVCSQALLPHIAGCGLKAPGGMRPGVT